MKSTKISIVLLSASLLFGITLYNILKKDDLKGKVVQMDATNAFNINDQELLTGFASNVFVGTVSDIEKSGEDEISSFTIYNVKVNENIKGELTEQVKVLQYICYDKKTKELYKFEGDTFLEEKKQFIFYTRFDDLQNAYTIVAPTVGSVALNESNKMKEISKSKFSKKNEQDPIKKLRTLKALDEAKMKEKKKDASE